MERVSMSENSDPVATQGMSVVVWGAGAIGQSVAGHCEIPDSDLTVVDTNQGQVNALRRQGVRVAMPDHEVIRQVAAFTPDDLEGTFDVALLATKAQDIAAALGALRPHMRPGGTICFFQNGIEKWDEQLDGSDLQAVYVAISDLYATRESGGSVRYEGGGHLHIGTSGTPTDPGTLERIAAVLPEFRTTVTPNVFGFKWVKTAWACMIIATTLSDEPWEVVLRDTTTHPAITALIAEALTVAQADGVQVPRLDHFNPQVFLGRGEQAASGISAEFLSIADHLAPLAKRHGGPWYDLHTYQKKTEVDAQMAPLFDLAAHYGVELRMLPRLVDAIHFLENGGTADGNRLIVDLMTGENIK